MGIEKSPDMKINQEIQKLTLENREHLSLTGVKNTESFSENEIILFTNAGKLTIKGENLHIIVVNVDTGEFEAEGRITSLVYSKSSGNNKDSFFDKLFR